MKTFVLTLMLSGCALMVVADNIYVWMQPAVCATAQAGVHTLVPLVSGVTGAAADGEAVYYAGSWLVWPQSAAGAVGVERVETGRQGTVRFDAASGCLTVQAGRGSVVRVYALDGRLLAHRRLQHTSLNLNAQAWPQAVIVQVAEDGRQQRFKLMRTRR